MIPRTACLTLAALLAAALPAAAQEKYDITLKDSPKGTTTLIEKKETENPKTVIQDNAGKELKDVSQPAKAHHYVYRETILERTDADKKATKLKRQYTKAEE